MRLELRGITKRFGALIANDRIDLVVEPGEIHCLLGENGAGKSTLMNVLYGLYQADEGEILVDGVARTFHGPRDAIAAGIGMVHQHFMLVPVFTVAENVVLGDEQAGFFGRLDRRRARREVQEVSARYGLPVDPDARVENLPVGVQQRVEIVKALVREAQTLILDEPTAVLTPQEIDELFTVMNSLRAAGKSIVFITHKLKEVKAIADRITVIRNGVVVGEATADMSEQELAGMMVGRAVQLVVDKAPARTDGDEHAAAALEVSGLTVLDRHGNAAVDDVSFTVRGGEILGVAGVDGNGQSELARAIVGLAPARAGTVRLAGGELTGMSAKAVRDVGVGFVPEDRSHDGVVGDFTVAENLVLDLYDRPPFGGRFALDLGEIGRNAAARVGEFDIRPADPHRPGGQLSGGNQQKVVVARELSRPLKLLVAAQPTRGVDVGAQEFIHKRIVAERDLGRPVVVISTELDEVLALADRVAVMYRGRIVAIVPPGTSRERIGALMAGVVDADGEPGAADPAAAVAAAPAAGAGTTMTEPGEPGDQEARA